MLTSSIEKVTPADALRLLESNSNNRTLSDHLVLRYAEEMAAGRWKMNGEAVKVSTHGRLLDGQHRLSAVVRSGMAVDMLVIRGIDDDAFDTIDTGKGRTTGDILSISGYADSNNLASAIGHIYKIEKGAGKEWGTFIAPKSWQIAFASSNPRLAEILREESKQKIISRGYAAGLRFIFEMNSDANSANEFMRAIESGKFNDGRFNSLDENPAYRLREMLIARKSSRTNLRQWFIVAAFIKAWNSWITGTPRKQVKMTDGEAFPKINVKGNW